MRVAVLIPAYQAGRQLGAVLERLAALHPVADTLVVDDGSRDDTGDVARRAGVRVHAFPANRGKGHALIEGFRRLGDYDGVVTLDADGQHPPECLPAFLAALEGAADLALGARAFSGTMPLVRRLANGLASGWASWLAGQRVDDSQCGYRLYGRRLLERTPITPGRYEVETEVVVRAARLGFRVVNVPIPTVYASETSHIDTLHDVPRIAGVMARLTIEGAVPPEPMRRAKRETAAAVAAPRVARP